MNHHTITLTDALQAMKARDERGRPVPFDLQFCTKDGRLIEVLSATLGRVEPTGRLTPEDKLTDPYQGVVSRRKSSVYRNITLQNGQLRRVNIRLMLKFNGQRIVY